MREEIADSDAVLGYEPMAMIVALLAGKNVMRCIPPGSRACILPHAKIGYVPECSVDKPLATMPTSYTIATLGNVVFRQFRFTI